MALRTIYRTVLIFSIIAFFAVGVLGLPHFGMSMSVDMNGTLTMSDCSMPGEATACGMNPLEHIVSWQRMFTNISTQSFVNMILFLIVLAIIIGRAWIRQSLFLSQEPQASFQFFRQRKRTPLVAFLQELFSSGILHTKLF